MPEGENPAAGTHQGQPVLTAGQPLERARAAMVLLHGRGAGARDILTLVDDLGQRDVAYLAPQAANSSWYSFSFLAPMDQNEPYLSSALNLVASVIERVAAAGIPPERTILLGFSQGACLALEFAARHTRRYGGLCGLSGGLIGPDGTARNYEGAFRGTPVFLGCSDVDPHIPRARVVETADVLRRLGAEVTMRLYPGMGHTVNQDEIDAVRRMVEGVVASELAR